tara:strand:- start:237 stop:992 length:756 start_codon:yes stop_codon:yes gene_type:complete
MEFAVETAWQAGKITLRYFQSGVETEWKADSSPVTVADRSAEEYIRTAIERFFPGDGLVGEEYGVQGNTTGIDWIIDPIDGTKSFVQGIPLYGVLIAMRDTSGVQVGVVNMPALQEMVWAGRGEGCWWNGRPARVSSVDHLEEAAICYTDWTSFAENGKAAAGDRLTSTVRFCRSWGDCYGHLLVATGRAEAAFDPIMNAWDCGPLLPILEEAGGTFTDWHGKATIDGADAYSTNGHLFVPIAEQLNPAAR